jgi:hypothetical protein
MLLPPHKEARELFGQLGAAINRWTLLYDLWGVKDSTASIELRDALLALFENVEAVKYMSEGLGLDVDVRKTSRK